MITYAQKADKVEELIAIIKDLGGKAIAIKADLTQLADIRQRYELLPRGLNPNVDITKFILQ